MWRHPNSRGARGWGVRVLPLALLLAVPAALSAQDVSQKKPGIEARSGFNLHSSPGLRLTGNQFQCGITNKGATCGDEGEDPNLAGGFWPRGTPDAYMYRAGLQVLGVIPSDAGFAWAGDTTGAFFNEGRGNLLHGSPLTEIYNSLDAQDLAKWPKAGDVPHFPQVSAFICDTSLFAAALVSVDCGGTASAPVAAASQQDSWSAYWDGDPIRNNGRQHPMGIMVEQRSLAWNYPVGNESVLYFIYKFTNVTDNPYFQQLNESRFQVSLPDQGWRIDSIYVAFDSDADVTDAASTNYATALLPFNMGVAYDNNFFDSALEYPSVYFHPPFVEDAPGIIGVKYLRSPVDPATGEQVGLTSFSLHTNPSAANSLFPDPANVQQGWRYVSLNIDPQKGDPTCTFQLSEVKQRRSCALGQSPTDVRFFIGSGPFSLAPGQSATIAVAMTVSPIVNVPGIPHGPSADVKPGIPSLATGCGTNPADSIRWIDRLAGYIAPTSCPAPGEKLDQHNVRFVVNSLIGKALIAQSIFDAKFLLGFAPTAPAYTLTAGDNQVTIAWEKSVTEQAGDPYFEVAGDPDNPLYDPNYRKLDVEGYRIYRGTSASNMQLIAEFDFANSRFIDSACATDPTFTGGECAQVDTVDLVSPFVQFLPGDIKELASGEPIVTAGDTVHGLTNSGVPYTYVDKNVRNGFNYFYRVTAFDVNSLLAGPSSLESTSPVKSVMPEGLFSGDIAKIHTVPDPYYAVSAFDVSPVDRKLQFVNLPSTATIRIFSLSGLPVRTLVHENGSTIEMWDLKNHGGQFVASGVYFFHVTTPDGKSHVGKFTVVNGGFANR